MESASESASSEQIVVTGSRVPRADVVANSPVNVVSQEEIRLSAAVEVDRLLDALPQTVGSNGPSTNNPGSGTATVDLRNLGPERTLVLLNGRRMVGSGASGVVDLNNIPPALIERIEVVTGGASAVYGSDAMAGVVNFITKRDFQGVAFSGQAGITERGDSRRLSADATFGTNFADGRGNVTLSGGYFKRDQTDASQREFSATQYAEDTDADGNPIFVEGGSTTIAEGRFNSNTLDDLGILDSYGNPIGSLGVLVDASQQVAAYRDPEDRYKFRPRQRFATPARAVERLWNCKLRTGDRNRVFRGGPLYA